MVEMVVACIRQGLTVLWPMAVVPLSPFEEKKQYFVFLTYKMDRFSYFLDGGFGSTLINTCAK